MCCPRVRRLVFTAMTEPTESLHFLDYWRVVCSRKEIVIAVFLLIVATGIVLTYTMPKVYIASAIIAVKQERPDLPIFTPDLMRYDPYFLRTQFEIIQSRPVIEEVVRKLDLNTKLGKAYGYLAVLGDKSFDQTATIVGDCMNVQQYRDTNLIEIQIELAEPKASAPQLAADVANMIVAVYRELSTRRSREEIERALESLRESLEQQKKTVEKLEKNVNEIRHRVGITTMFSGRVDMGRLDDLRLREIEALKVRLRLELEDKKATHEKVASLADKELLYSQQPLVGDKVLEALVHEKRQADIRLRDIQDSLGAKHPDVTRLVAAIDEIQTKVIEQLKGLRTGVLHNYETAQAKFTAVEVMLEEFKATRRHDQSTGYLEFDKARADLEQARKIRDMLDIRVVEEIIKLRMPKTIVALIEPAKPSSFDDPAKPNTILYIMLSVLVGITSGIGLAYFVEYLDTSVKTIEEIERYMNIPVVGVIPQKVKPFVDETAEGVHQEAYRVLRTNIQLSKRVKDAKTFCFTSGSVAEGKSLTLFNLAYVCAQLGDRVLIVDSDLYRPRQHKILGISNTVGLVNMLLGEVNLEDSILSTSVPNMDVLPSGKLSSRIHGLLDTWRMKEFVQTVKKSYDCIFFDAPPIIGVSDASLLIREMDAVLLIVQHRKYPRGVSNRAKGMIENISGNLVGVVLNKINVSRDYSYYYYQQHSYYYP